MKKEFLTLLLILVSFLSMKSQEKYKTINLKEINEMEKEKEVLMETFYILENGVYVTIYKDGTSILRPPALTGEEGLLFYDLEEMRKMIASGKYPVREYDSFWKEDQDKLKNFDNEIPYFLNKLSKLINFKIEINYDENYLKRASEAINAKLKSNKDKQAKYFYTALFIGELVRNKRSDATWKLIPQPSFNVYYEPELFINDKNSHIWTTVTGELKLIKMFPLNLEKIYKEMLE